MINFESHIQGEKPVIAHFFAEWSDGSRLMLPVLQEIKENLGQRASVLNIDIDNEPELVKSFHIKTVPTIIILKKGKQLWSKTGFTPVHEILEHMQSVID